MFSARVYNESLLFQPGSKFSQELISHFEEVYTHIRTLGEVGINEAFPTVLDFFEKVTVPKLTKTTLTHTGVTITKFAVGELYHKGVPSCSGMFAIDYNSSVNKKSPSPVKPMATMDASGVVLGYQSKNTFKPSTADQMSKALANFDELIGVFKVPNKVTDNIKCTVYWDIATAYFVDLIVNNKLSRLTAQEQAAIFIHEIYHVIGVYSYYKYAFHSAHMVKGAFEYFNKYADDQEKLKFLKTKSYRRLLSDKDPKTAKVIKPLDAVIDELPNNIVTTGSNDYGAGIAKWIIGRLLSLVVMTIAHITETVFFFYVTASFLIRGILSDNMKRNDKDEVFRTSDIKFTRMQGYTLERMADEGVISHNMGSFLQSGLMKMDSLRRFLLGSYGLDSNNSTIMKTSTINFHLTSAIGVLFDLTLSMYGNIYRMHEPTGQRVRTIAKQQIENIRMTTETPHLQRLAIAEYERCYEQAGQSGLSAFLEILGDKLHIIMFNIINVIPIASKTVINRTQEEQASRILTKCESLVNNDLFVSALKLR